MIELAGQICSLIPHDIGLIVRLPSF